MANDRSAIIRNKVADYLYDDENALLMGTGFTTLDESPGAQSDSVTYINEATSSSDITSYETEFSYEAEHIPSQDAVAILWRDGRDHHVGADAQHEYIRVDLYNPVKDRDNTYRARKFTVANEVSDYSGAGGEKLVVSGTLKAVGDPVQGTFDLNSLTFTEGEAEGDYIA